MFKNIRYDIQAIKEHDPAARSSAEVFFLYSGFHAILYYRFSHFLYLHKRYFLARWVSQHARRRTGIEIHPGAKIGRGVLIDHGMSVVIGETAEIGDNCIIYQGVTLGGTGKDKGKRHPTLGNNVMVGAGAKILGPFHVGDNAKIAANAVVLKEVPPNSTAVGVPAQIVRLEGQRVGRTIDQTLDQIHIPDPVESQINILKEHIAQLEKTMEEKK